MKTLILDYAKWRCGFFGPLKIGYGFTQLENAEGFQCCLGQFSFQLSNSLKPEDIKEITSPSDLRMKIPLLTVRNPDKNDIPKFISTKLAQQAMTINDEETTTPQQKIKLLKSIFSKNGYKIEVINQPKKEQI